MKTGKMLVLLCAVGAIGLASLLATSVAQDAEARVGDDEVGRLPAGYAAIVKKSQRKTIYAIQDKYQKQIDVLNKQIAVMEQERDAEIADVLTDEQKQVLVVIRKLRAEERAEEKAEEAKAVAAANSGDSN